MVPFVNHDISFSLELQYAIIDYLRSDFRSLSQCSAVCKSWRLYLYQYKFSRITLAWASVLFLAELFKSEFSASALIPSVKSIHIRGPPIAICTWDVQRIAAIEQIFRALSASRNIREFSLRNLVWTTPPLEAPSLSGLSAVSTLELLRTSFYTRTELVAFFENFQGLQHLVLENVDCMSPPQTPVILNAVPPGSYGLSLRCPPDFSLRKCLRWDCVPNGPNVSAGDLADLIISMSGWHNEVAAILPLFGTSLHCLQLDTQTIHTYFDATINELDLSSTTSLELLSLGSPKRILSLLPWVPVVLKGLPKTHPPTLLYLEFAFASSHQFHLDKPALMNIAHILESPQFQRLQKIHFLVFGATGDQELLKLVKHMIYEVFENWRDTGVLTFTVTFART